MLGSSFYNFFSRYSHSFVLVWGGITRSAIASDKIGGIDLALMDITKMFSKIVVLIDTPTSKVNYFWLLLTFTDTYIARLILYISVSGW